MIGLDSNVLVRYIVQDWSLLATCVVGATLAGLGVYHAVAGYYHYRYYVLRRHEPETWKCQPDRFLTAPSGTRCAASRMRGTRRTRAE